MKSAGVDTSRLANRPTLKAHRPLNCIISSKNVLAGSLLFSNRAANAQTCLVAASAKKENRGPNPLAATDAAVNTVQAPTTPSNGSSNTAATATDYMNNITTAPKRPQQTQPSPQKTFEKIDYMSYWWPVVPAAQVDTSRPMKVELLGMQLVVWQDSKNTWHCFQDRCPHRLAPLSEGKVMEDELMCSYHGWQFNKEGKCTLIPQIENPKAHATACASPRNCTTVYPIQVVHGLLWIYPKGGAQGAKEAAECPMPKTAIPALLESERDPKGSNFFQSTAWFFRDMPIRYDTLVENTIDPSHVSDIMLGIHLDIVIELILLLDDMVYFAHHGAPGVKRSQLVNPAMTAADNGKVTAEGGFMVTRGAVNSSPESQYGLKPPHLISYLYPYSESHFYCVPTKPGWSRVITCMVGKKDAEIPKPLQFMSKLMSRWPVIEHVLLRHEILDGDLYMLHAGERQLIAEGNSLSNYYMPANADLSVTLWRKWLNRHAGPIPTCTKEDEAKMQPLMNKEQCLNRYEQHTASCKTCQTALKNVERAQIAAGLLGIVALVATVSGVTSGTPLLSVNTILGAVLAACCGGAVAMLSQLRQKFFFVEYVHAHK